MRLLIRTEWAILGGQGIKTHVFLNFWRQNIVKSTILGILSALKSCYYYCEYVCNFTRKFNEKLGPQNNVVTLAVRNCNNIQRLDEFT